MISHSPLSMEQMPPTPLYSGSPSSMRTLAGTWPLGAMASSSVRSVARCAARMSGSSISIGLHDGEAAVARPDAAVIRRRCR